jgi:hypothetical protein
MEELKIIVGYFVVPVLGLLVYFLPQLIIYGVLQDLVRERKQLKHFPLVFVSVCVLLSCHLAIYYVSMRYTTAGPPVTRPQYVKYLWIAVHTVALFAYLVYRNTKGLWITIAGGLGFVQLAAIAAMQTN